MKNKNLFIYLLLTIILVHLNQLSFAQIDSTIYGVSRNSTGVKFAKINPTTGTVTDISTSDVAGGFSLSGSCLNPYENTFTFFGGTIIKTIDINTGLSIASPSITMPSTAQYFQYPFFNNSDSTIYGLMRGNTYDSTTMTNVGVMYLGTIEPMTGIVNQISSTSIGQGILLNTGYTVDPYMKIYYYADNPNSIKGIDMYTGNIYSTTAVSRQVSNIVYNCNDNNMYGMVSTLFYDTIIDPDTLLPPMIVLDSAALQLARIDMSTGNVTVLSSGSVGAMYSFNAGITIDPINNLYYYQAPGRLIGISMTTGDIVNNSIINNITAAPYFDLMRHYQNCYTALPRRNNTLSIDDIEATNFTVYPNPSNDFISINTDNNSSSLKLTIIDMLGKEMMSMNYEINSQINISALNIGQYVLVLQDETGNTKRIKFLKN
jgi:hypothetical protein